MKIKHVPRLAPSHIIILSFLATIGIGAALLSLPIAQNVSISFLDIIFTSISSVTTTGMFTIDLHNFTPFGQAVVIGLVQIGALGLIVLFLGLLYAFFEFEKPLELLVADSLGIEKKRNLKQLTYWILGLTLVIELVGAIALYFPFKTYFGSVKGWWYALFHSISAFSNAGVTLFDGYSMSMFKNDLSVQIPFYFIMLSGILGFVILREFFKYFTAQISRKKYSFSLSNKVAAYTTISLIVIATILFFVLEDKNSLAAKNFMYTFANSFFNAIGSAGVGFSTIYMTALRTPTLLVIMIMAFIGTAPGSTGSGIRTTTVAVAIASVRAVIFGKDYVSLFGTRIPRDEIRRAIAIIALSVPWVIFATFLLAIIEPEFTFLQILFESVSSFATLGLSTGITPHITTLSKIILMINMILGRIGPFTLIFALRKALNVKKNKDAILLD